MSYFDDDTISCVTDNSYFEEINDTTIDMLDNITDGDIYSAIDDVFNNTAFEAAIRAAAMYTIETDDETAFIFDDATIDNTIDNTVDNAVLDAAINAVINDEI